MAPDGARVARAQRAARRVGGDSFGGAPDLPAGRGLLVDHQRGETRRAGDGRRGEPGRPGTDDRDVDGRHAAGSVVTVRPSRTGTMQACSARRPSMVTRQPKQTPIRQ